jgi:hypothetical protein
MKRAGRSHPFAGVRTSEPKNGAFAPAFAPLGPSRRAAPIAERVAGPWKASRPKRALAPRISDSYGAPYLVIARNRSVPSAPRVRKRQPDNP